MAKATYWCFQCYGHNDSPRGTCVHCGGEIGAPEGIDYDERLMWTLGHPDADRAVVAAKVLGVRKSRRASAKLRSVALGNRDPFLAAEALRSLIAIEGVESERSLLEALAVSQSFLVAAIAKGALENRREDSG